MKIRRHKLSSLLLPLLLPMAALLPCQLAAAPTVSLLTCSPGPAVYELDGHTGLRVADADTGVDLVVNWGLFDFNSPNFLWRFVTGRTDYMCGATSTEHFISSYTRAGRTVTEQVLDLTPAQTDTLLRLLDTNLRPEHRTYRYNYVKDNCATRPLELIEQAVGRPLDFGPGGAGISFRDEMRANHRLYPWYQFGIDLALGPGIDYELTPRQTAFSPLRLQRLMTSQPLVSHTVVHGSPTLQLRPTPWWLSPMAVCWTAFALVLALSVADLRRGRESRWADTVLFGAMALAGCLIAFLVTVSSHEATSPNWLLLWLNPLCALGAILPWIKSAKKALFCYHFINFAVLILLLLCWKLTGQSLNGAFIPLILMDMTRSGTMIMLCRRIS